MHWGFFLIYAFVQHIDSSAFLCDSIPIRLSGVLLLMP
mgnify:CR=1 FL=1|jgi:hypothetical protein